MISSDVLKALGYCQVQETFGMLQSWFCFTFQSLPLPSTSSGNSLLMAGTCSDGGKNPLTRKGFSAVERISDPCWMKLIRSALNSGCAGSHWVGFWQLAWLSDCNVICLQWQTGTGTRADCGLPGSWEVDCCSRRDHTWLRTPACVMMNGRWVQATKS